MVHSRPAQYIVLVLALLSFVHPLSVQYIVLVLAYVKGEDLASILKQVMARQAVDGKTSR